MVVPVLVVIPDIVILAWSSWFYPSPVEDLMRFVSKNKEAQASNTLTFVRDESMKSYKNLN